MGDILPFISRVQAQGGWSGSERASLEALAHDLSIRVAPVDVAFGATEAGDPWCVVTDQHEEVLIHVARIGSRVVVHYAAEDVMDEAADLRSALSQRLATDPSSNFRPANDHQREVQILMALIVTTAFVLESNAAPSDYAPPADADIAPQEGADPVAVAELPARADMQSKSPARADAPLEAGPVKSAASAAETGLKALAVLAGLAPASAEATQTPDAGASAPPPVFALADAPELFHYEAGATLRGGASDDVITGGQGADLILGGGGNDTLSGGGAPDGRLDTLHGGAGDDQIHLDASTLAYGDEGADTFVINLEAAVPGGSDTNLGAIGDFRIFEGDRIISGDGREVFLRVADQTHQETAPATPGDSDKAAPPRTQDQPEGPVVVEVDLGGDGVVDGYLTFNGGLSAAEHTALLTQYGVPGAGLGYPDGF